MKLNRKLFIIDNKEDDRKHNLKIICDIFRNFNLSQDYEIISNQVDDLVLRNSLKRKMVWRRSKLMFLYSFRARIMLKLNLSQILVDGIKDLIRIFFNTLRYHEFYKKIKIEMNLTQKHLYCWRNQIQQEIDFSIIAENDLHLTGNNFDSIKSLEIMLRDSNLIFFSHSVDPYHLMLNKVTIKQTKRFIVFNRILSNGCSGYCVPLDFAKKFVDVVTKLPDLVLLPVDLMIVAIGWELERRNKLDLSTVFIFPSDFIHLSGGGLESRVQI